MREREKVMKGIQRDREKEEREGMRGREEANFLACLLLPKSCPNQTSSLSLSLPCLSRLVCLSPKCKPSPCPCLFLPVPFSPISCKRVCRDDREMREAGRGRGKVRWPCMCGGGQATCGKKQGKIKQNLSFLLFNLKSVCAQSAHAMRRRALTRQKQNCSAT